PAMWDALAEMARRERLTIHELCTAIQSRRQESTLTAAIRVHILVYLREAATEQGHELAGHGRLTDSPGRAAGDGGPGCEGRGSGLYVRGGSGADRLAAQGDPSRGPV